MRWAPLWVALLFFALAGAWLSLDTARAQHAYDSGSALDTGPEGLSLARAFLAQQGNKVSLLESTLDVSRLPADALLVRVDPSPRLRQLGHEEEIEPIERGASDGGDAGPGDAGAVGGDGGTSLQSILTGPDDDDEDDWHPNHPDAGSDGGTLQRKHARGGFDPFALSETDEAFVLRGGTLLLAAHGETRASAPAPGDLSQDGSDDESGDEGDDPGESAARDGGEISANDGDDAASNTRAAPPLPDKVLPLLPGVHALALQPASSLPASALIDTQPVFEVEGSPAVAVRKLGAGEIWLVDSPALFENEALGEGDHLALLAALAAPRRPVIFDETVHGISQEGGLLELMRRWGLLPALFIAGLAGALFFWRRAATLGTPADGWRDTRSEAIDFVDSAASLFERALVPSDALALYRTHIVREIALHLGLSSDEGARRLDKLAPGLATLKPGESLTQREFQTQLKLLTHALERFRDEHRRSGDV